MDRTFTVAAEYLVLPVGTTGDEGDGAAESDEDRLRLVVGGRTVLGYGVNFAYPA